MGYNQPSPLDLALEKVTMASYKIVGMGNTAGITWEQDLTTGDSINPNDWYFVSYIRDPSAGSMDKLRIITFWTLQISDNMDFDQTEEISPG
jgi:hypothetical protein